MADLQGDFDFVVVGSGPNGLTAALTLARSGSRVLLLEASDIPGGGCQSAELTLPGFVHDVCSAVHPMAVLSPAFQQLRLTKLGVEFLWPDISLAHPLPDGDAVCLHRSVERTAADLGQDGASWRSLTRNFSDQPFLQSLLKPMWFGLEFPWRKLRFGLAAMQSCQQFALRHFRGPRARALFTGCAAHSAASLDRPGTAAFGLMLALAGHVAGWPCVRRGSSQITNVLLRAFQQHGGILELKHAVTSLSELPAAKAVLFDLNPRQVARICKDALPSGYRKRLDRFKPGPGVFKLDWALDGPIPWQNPDCARAGTVHVGGTFEEILQAEKEVAQGTVCAKPFVLVAQPSLFDPTRSPAGKHTAWAYCHVPNGCTQDLTDVIEAQVQRFAPGFRDRILARHAMNALQVESHNAAMQGGDIAGGANTLLQVLFRPVPRWNPYATPNPRLFICSSSTPPGGGVHGMCGWLAAHTARRAIQER